MKVNGKLKNLALSTNLEAIITALGLSPDRVAVELNGNVVPRSEYASVVPKEDDTVEIVSFVGGG